MKKTLIIIAFLLILILMPLTVLRGADTGGLVPCGAGSPIMKDSSGKTVPNPSWRGCTILDFFAMLTRIYRFIVVMIATPLAIIGLIIGAIFMMLSAGNPGVMGKGKTILYASIIGLVLVFCSWVIINFIMTTLGYSLGNWWQL